MSSKPLYTKTIKRGAMWSNVIGRGKTLRLTDLEGGANVGMLLYNEAHPIERYNMPDTLKGQHIFYLTAPYCLHSDMGRIFCSITEDTAGWHDTVCGCSDAKLVKEKYGESTFQDSRNDFYRNAKENFLIELGKWGLGKKDLVPNLNLFSKVVSDENGSLSYVEGASKAGDHIDLRFEMDSIVVINTCQHPLDPSPQYAPKEVKLEVFQSPTPDKEDACRLSRPENERAFENTEDYYALRG
ncbi:urea carboxylase-associated family protein [Puniceicoccaceae bacterium K14]|nr:urea carboxylase-associated family protein [Puniceicoccaceae bacterium K14]